MNHENARDRCSVIHRIGQQTITLKLSGAFRITMEEAMWMKRKPRLVASVLVSSVIAGVAGPVAHAQDFACTAYEHRDFRGAARGLNPNQSANNSKLGDRISSFKMVRGCRVVAYENSDFKGPNAQWTQSTTYVGDNWNDLISSWRCLCN